MMVNPFIHPPGKYIFKGEGILCIQQRIAKNTGRALSTGIYAGAQSLFCPHCGLQPTKSIVTSV